MKKLNEIKQDRGLKDLYAEAMESLFDKIRGQILHCQRCKFDSVLIVELKFAEHSDEKIEVTVLHNEKTITYRCNGWTAFSKDFLTRSEYERRKDGLEMLKKLREGFSKVNNTPRYRPRRPPGNIRYK